MKVLDRPQSRIPQPWRTLLDWLVTIAVAAAFVLAFQAAVAKPYVIPTSSMEPTLHCAKPADFCEGRFNDRVIANRLAYRFGDPERGQIVVFTAPRALNDATQVAGSAFVKRIVGLPGEMVSERDGVIHINGDRLVEPYVDPLGEDTRTVAGHASRQATTSSSATTGSLLRLPHMGNGVPRRPDRPGDPHVLAAEPPLAPLGVTAPEPGWRRLRVSHQLPGYPPHTKPPHASSAGGHAEPSANGVFSMGWRRGELWFEADVAWFGEGAAAPAVAGLALPPLPSFGPTGLHASRQRREAWRRRRRTRATVFMLLPAVMVPPALFRSAGAGAEVLAEDPPSLTFRIDPQTRESARGPAATATLKPSRATQPHARPHIRRSSGTTRHRMACGGAEA